MRWEWCHGSLKVDGVDAVAAVHSGQCVVVVAALCERHATPNVRQFVVAYGSRFSEMVGRVYVEDKAEDTVAVGFCCLKIDFTDAGLVDGKIVPEVGQFAAAECDRVLEQVGRVHDDGDLVDFVAACFHACDGVTVNTRLGKGQVAPFGGFALAQDDGVTFHPLRLIDGELQAVDAVAAVHGGQGVVINAGLVQRKTVPQIGQCVVADTLRLFDEVDLVPALIGQDTDGRYTGGGFFKSCRFHQRQSPLAFFMSSVLPILMMICGSCASSIYPRL